MLWSSPGSRVPGGGRRQGLRGPAVALEGPARPGPRPAPPGQAEGRSARGPVPAHSPASNYPPGPGATPSAPPRLPPSGSGPHLGLLGSRRWDPPPPQARLTLPRVPFALTPQKPSTLPPESLWASLPWKTHSLPSGAPGGSLPIRVVGGPSQALHRAPGRSQMGVNAEPQSLPEA